MKISRRDLLKSSALLPILTLSGELLKGDERQKEIK